MAPVFLLLALVVQSTLTFAHVDDKEDSSQSRNMLKNKLEIDDDVVKDFHSAKVDWMDMFLLPDGVHPTSSAALMAHATKSDKSIEEQLEDIKEMANRITTALQSEMVNLLSFAVSDADKSVQDNGMRKKRSVETPMDSTQLVMRLLKHIKSNNEFQNIALEKMMSAQEIAVKYGIDFTPDPEVVSDLVVAANENAQQLTDIIKDAFDVTNATQEQVEFVPLDKQYCPIELGPENDAYYEYLIQHEDPRAEIFSQNPFPVYEYAPEQIKVHPSRNHVQSPDHERHTHHYNYPTPSPVHQCPPVTPRPNYYDSMMARSPVPELVTHCFEPVTTTTTIVFPIEEPIQPEPELVGEEYEETVTSKVTVNHEEPGSSTVNHVTTYTINEKAHFRTPEIEKLPQQMQYTFFLI